MPLARSNRKQGKKIQILITSFHRYQLFSLVASLMESLPPIPPLCRPCLVSPLERAPLTCTRRRRCKGLDRSTSKPTADRCSSPIRRARWPLDQSSATMATPTSSRTRFAGLRRPFIAGCQHPRCCHHPSAQSWPPFRLVPFSVASRWESLHVFSLHFLSTVSSCLLLPLISSAATAC